MLGNSVKLITTVNHLMVCSHLRPKLGHMCTLMSLRKCSTSLSTTVITKQNSEKPVPEPGGNSTCLDSTCELITAKIQSTHGSKFNYSFDNLRSVVECLSKDVSESRLVELFVKQPELCTSYGRKWQAVVVALCENGLTVADIVEMLMVYPQLLQMNADKVHQVFNCLREHGFADEHLISVIIRAPLLLVTTPQFITEQIQCLMTMFTHKDILKLAVKCPNVLFDDFEDTERKVQYIVYEIGVDQKQIVSSCALAHSLFHIELRHQIMSRAGIYRKPHPKKKIDNVHLKVMVDSLTGEFVENIVGISMEEFGVFEKMLLREVEKRQDKAESSDSDEELSDNYK